MYCDHSALVHILKAKREPPTLRLKKLIENLSEYKFDIYFIKGKEIHTSDFLSRHPDDEGSPNEIIPIAFMLQELGNSKFPDHLQYLNYSLLWKKKLMHYLNKTITYHIRKVIFFSYFQMTSMKICNCYQTCMGLNAQELIPYVYVNRKGTIT